MQCLADEMIVTWAVCIIHWLTTDSVEIDGRTMVLLIQSDKIIPDRQVLESRCDEAVFPKVLEFLIHFSRTIEFTAPITATVCLTFALPLPFTHLAMRHGDFDYISHSSRDTGYH